MIIQGRASAQDIAAAYILAKQGGMSQPTKSTLVWVAFKLLGDLVRKKDMNTPPTEEAAIEFLKAKGIHLSIGRSKRGLQDIIQSVANEASLDGLAEMKAAEIEKLLDVGDIEKINKIKSAKSHKEITEIIGE